MKTPKKPRKPKKSAASTKAPSTEELRQVVAEYIDLQRKLLSKLLRRVDH
ncbi:hypothetical protein GGE24_000136 [Bradyrhizobium centrosematis]|jgi:hypothetical protein|nr:hypothetical protein [Bradyrhizobium centrosematis]MCS3770824.1 hypothetical protein [Bradyrhizobium centrosematis]